MSAATESERGNRRGLGPVVGGLVLLAIMLGLAFWGIATRAKALAVVTKETRQLAVPTVTVVSAERGVPQEEISLPGSMQAFTDASIYARTNGYLKRRLVDIGVARSRRRSCSRKSTRRSSTRSSSRRGRI